MNSAAAAPHDVVTSDGFSRFYRANLPVVYDYLHRLCGGDRGLAEDLTQDTWIALAERLRDGRVECADVRWLLTVARSRFLDHARRQHRLAHRLTVLRGSLEDGAWDGPQRHEVLAGMSTLEPMHRLVLMLRYVDDMSVPAVAHVIGRNITATNSLLARARTALRLNLGSATND